MAFRNGRPLGAADGGISKAGRLAAGTSATAAGGPTFPSAYSGTLSANFGFFRLMAGRCLEASARSLGVASRLTISVFLTGSTLGTMTLKATSAAASGVSAASCRACVVEATALSSCIGD